MIHLMFAVVLAAQPGPQTDAARTWGEWDNQRGCVEICPCGQINVRYQTYKFSGTYTAKGDILYVTWSNGRKTNIRWYFYGRKLVLVTHDGLVFIVERHKQGPPKRQPRRRPFVLPF